MTSAMSSANTDLGRGTRPINRPSLRQRLRVALFLPILRFAAVLKLPFKFRSVLNNQQLSFAHVDEAGLADEKEFERILSQIGEVGTRSTGSKAHNDLIAWIENELQQNPGLRIQSEEIQLLGWHSRGSLYEAGKLIIDNDMENGHKVLQIAGVVPYSLPTACQTGKLIYLPGRTSLSAQDIRGKMVLRDFPLRLIPYALGMLPAYHHTPDLNVDLGGTYERPGLADQPIHEDLLEAGRSGAAGVIFMFDIEREQVESYWEPHKGTHYKVPAVYVGIEEGLLLKQKAARGFNASLSVDAFTLPLTTRNLSAVLPGQIDERVIYITHTDGNTHVQENGAAALLTLAEYFAKQPLSSRRRTLEFRFNTGHLHISREGSLKHARHLHETNDQNHIALVIPVEHLGAREIEALPRSGNRPGRRLEFTGRGELMFWCTGPSHPVVRAVKEAVARRKLDRVLISRGVSLPNVRGVPTFTSFGGIGTYYHNLLLPTTSLISGPWSLWAPKFGIHAIDIRRFRQQTLALGDIYLAIDLLAMAAVLGGYADYRKCIGKLIAIENPPEIASESSATIKGAVKY